MVLPRKKQVLFNPGPVNLHPAVQEGLFNIELCHRQPEFEALASSIRARLHRATGLDVSRYRLSLLHGGGTLAVDAALVNFVRGKVLVVNNGVYCQRFIDTLEGVPETQVTELDPGLGRVPDIDELAELMRQVRPAWVAIVHHETTTGLLNPLPEIAKLAREHDCRLFVDAVSSLGAHPVDVGADVICFSSSKCLEALPGIAGVFWSNDLVAHPSVHALDVPAHAEGVPSTPNVQAFVSLDIALDLLESEDRPDRYRRLAQCVWEVGGHHFQPLLPIEARSHVLTGFLLDGHDPDELFLAALRHGFVTYPGQGKLRMEIFRVANMGAEVRPETIAQLFEVIG